jgi:cobyrinic acid a,c-diamide synthase
MSAQAAVGSFIAAAEDADVAVIEGNRGLFDGMDAAGTFSTAVLAKLLQVPVLLVVDCTKSTRSVAAIVLGCQQLDPQVPIQGIILNRTAGARHESVVRQAIEQISGLPVVGAVARIREPLFPERHLGLVPPQEHSQLVQAIEQAADVAEQYLDLGLLWKLAGQAPLLEPEENPETGTEPKSGSSVTSAFEVQPAADPRCVAGRSGELGPPLVQTAQARIGVFRDAAFQFYYPENLEALVREGASLIEISPMRDALLPDVDALYVGGGFPETLAPALSGNRPFIESLRRSVEKGLPVYAECGGTVFLGQKLVYQQKHYPMAGVLPAVFSFQKKPQGHGYVELESVQPNPFYRVGQTLRGHEFHYTYLESSTADDLTFAFRVHRGHGFDGQRDGLCSHSVLALYTHVHALGTQSWAPSLVQAAVRFKEGEE